MNDPNKNKNSLNDYLKKNINVLNKNPRYSTLSNNKDTKNGLNSYLNFYFSNDSNKSTNYGTEAIKNDYRRQYSNSLFVDQEDTRFTGSMPGGKREKEYLDYFSSEKSHSDLKEIQAQRQPWTHQAARGTGRFGVEFAANILQMPGYVGGAVGALGNEVFGDGEDSMDIFLNNAWVDLFEDAKENFNNEVAPIYIRKAVEEGSLVRQIFSPEFWATEGASGLAFLLSAVVPGAAINKLGVGMKLANATKATNLFGKGKGGKILQKADEIAEFAGLQSLQNGTNVVSATVLNTLYEAGVEADSGLESFRENLRRRYLDGEITKDQYTQLYDQGPARAADIFKSNVALLTLPNLIMSKALFGKALPKNVIDKFEFDGKKITPVTKELTKLDKAKKVGKIVGGAFASEGLIEEAGQMASEKYFTEEYLNSQLNKDSKSFAETYLDVIKSTDGQKAMFLGGLFGSAAYAFGNHRQRKANKEREAQLAELMTNGVNFYESAVGGIYQRDEDNNIVLDEFGVPKIDRAKVAELGSKVDFINRINAEKKIYKALADKGVEGAQEKLEILDRNITNSMLYTFVHAGEDGIAVLKNYLENSPGVDEMISQLNENKEGKKISKNDYVSNLVNEAEQIKNDLDYYNKYGNYKENLVNSDEDAEIYQEYGKMVSSKYASVKSNLRYLDKVKAEKKEALDRIKEELRVSSAQIAEDTREELETSNVKELKALAKQYGMTGYSKLKKAELIEAIQSQLSFDEKTSDAIDKMEKGIKSTQELIDDNRAELEGLMSLDKQKEAFSKFKANEIKKKKAEEEAKELDEYLQKIRNSNNKTELNQLSVPSKFENNEAALAAIEKVKKEQEENFKKREAALGAQGKRKNEEELEEEEKAKAEKIKALKFIEKRYNKGEEIDPSLFGVDEQYNIYEDSNESSLTLKNKDGDTITIPIEEAYNKIYQPNEEFVVESKVIEDTFVPDESSTNPNQIKQNKDARLAITDNKKEGPVSILFDDLFEAYKFEISPNDKRGYYGISLNPSYKNKATEIYNKEGVTEDNFQYLLDNLPLAMVLDKDRNITAPFENKTSGDTTVYKNTTEKLKRTILKELQKGTDISNIEVKIKGQYSGKIQTQKDPKTGLPSENKISDLFYFGGDVNNIKASDFYVSMDTGELINSNGDVFPTRRQDFPPGEMYIIIKTANGRDFPLKLNTQKVTEDVADFLHSLYVARGKEFVGGKLINNALGKQRKLSQSQLDDLKTRFPEVYEIIKNQNIKDQDISIKHVTDFFIYDNTSNIKSRVKFTKEGLAIGENVLSFEELENDKNKFIKALTSVKRRQVSLKPYVKKDENSGLRQNYNFSLTNPEYLKYVIENKVLNTNASTESKFFKEEGLSDPIFQERTTMYVETTSVRVNGQLSEFNEADQVSYSKQLFGSKQNIKNVLPQLLEDGIELDEEIGMYLTAEDRKAIETYKNQQSKRTPEQILEFKRSKGMKRVSSLSPFTGTQNDKSIAGQVRGDVVDTLIREFFSPLQQINTNLRFADRGLEILERENKRKSANVQMTREWFLEELWPVVKKYGELFDQEGYTVYGDEFPVMLKIDGERYAGTGDLLVYDNKNKVWGLIDIKTSSINREDDYNSEKSVYKYKLKDQIQQNAYKEAYRQTAKLDIAFSKIMPITAPPTDKQGNPTNYIGAKVNYGKKITGDKLFDYLLDVNTDKNIFELLGKKNENAGKIETVPLGEVEKVNADEAVFEAPEETLLEDFEGILSSLPGQENKNKQPENTVKTNTGAKTPEQRAIDSFLVQDKVASPISLVSNGKESNYFVSAPIVVNGKFAGGFIIVNASTNKIVTNRNEFDKVAAAYNKNIVFLNTMFGSSHPRMGEQSLDLAYKFVLGQHDFNAEEAFSTPTQVVNSPSKKENMDEVEKKEEEVKEEKVKKSEKELSLVDRINESNVKEVYKLLKSSGLINASNRKAVSNIIKRNGSNEVQGMREVLEHLIESGVKKEVITKNCKL